MVWNYVEKYTNIFCQTILPEFSEETALKFKCMMMILL